MGKSAGAYRSEKRRKELTRLKKREAKRMKRLHKTVGEGQGDAPHEAPSMPIEPTEQREQQPDSGSGAGSGGVEQQGEG